MSFSIEVPGKVFLLGEYAVLHGVPAWVAAVGPRFKFTLGGESTAVHPDSPAGRFLSRGESRSFLFNDPWQGAGGFGASSAQFAAAFFDRELAQGAPSYAQAWATYQEMQDSQSRGSGADLIAQWQGGISRVTLSNPAQPLAESLTPFIDSASLIIFSATRTQPERKVRTHEHLARFQAAPSAPAMTEALRAKMREAEAALDSPESERLPRLGRVFSDYGDILCAHDLEDPRTSEDRRTLGAMAGVLGIKGCGAMQADALVAVWDPQTSRVARMDFIEAALARGLTLVADGLPAERGITWSVS